MFVFTLGFGGLGLSTYPFLQVEIILAIIPRKLFAGATPASNKFLCSQHIRESVLQELCSKLCRSV